MNRSSAVRFFCIMMSVVLLAASVSSAPSVYSDYDSNVRDLLEFLMQREVGEDRLGLHQVVRKAGRSPQLRLRFGKRPDATFPGGNYMNVANEPEQ